MYKFRQCRGLALIWVAVMMTVFTGFIAIGLDTWLMVYSAQQLQVAADASALAGAQWVLTDQAIVRDAAINAASRNSVSGDGLRLRRNDANAPDGDIVIGFYDEDKKNFTPTLESPNAVRVFARRTNDSLGGSLPLVWASVFESNHSGSGTADIERSAIAITAAAAEPGIIVLNESMPCSLDIQSSTTNLVINDGGIQVNSSSQTAVCIGGSPTLDATGVFVTGNVDGRFYVLDYDGSLQTGVPAVSDPLAGLPEPNSPLLPGTSITVEPKDTLVLPPGAYDSIVAKGRLTLLPGLYYINSRFEVTSTANLTGEQVMIFIGPAGEMNIDGQGAVNLTPMQTLIYPAGPLVPGAFTDSEVTLFQSRANNRQARITGGSAMSIGGTIYLPKAKLLMKGHSGNVAQGIIVDQLEVEGSGALRVNYDGRFPALPGYVYLIQ